MDSYEQQLEKQNEQLQEKLEAACIELENEKEINKDTKKALREKYQNYFGPFIQLLLEQEVTLEDFRDVVNQAGLDFKELVDDIGNISFPYSIDPGSFRSKFFKTQDQIKRLKREIRVKKKQVRALEAAERELNYYQRKCLELGKVR